MIDTVTDTLLSLLDSPTLYAGGNAYPVGWLGLKFPDSGDIEESGYISIFERPYVKAGDAQRPAIYLGTEKLEILIHRGEAVMSGVGENRGEFWWASVPLVLACSSHVSLKDARKQRNQLFANVVSLLWAQIFVQDAWWNLSFADHLPIQLSASGTGGGAQGVAEAIATIPLTISFAQTGNSLA